MVQTLNTGRHGYRLPGRAAGRIFAPVFILSLKAKPEVSASTSTVIFISGKTPDAKKGQSLEKLTFF